ncbi:MAG: hypothetical protein EOP07_01885 [Proteobacteria bacterium]|nr:MAG: hypothetical protein EOP07_01885 [Pseudomonadota bacterium]
MNFEQHDNFLLADWVCQDSPLSNAGQKELDQLEEFYRFACEQAAKERVQAVLWLQKVPCYDASEAWVKELTTDLLRDQLRSRLLRLHKLTRMIRSSPIPWIYATEKDCCGTMFELMQACHKRFVFDRDTWFGFPEFAIGQVSALGWLGAQLQKQPALAKVWMARSVISAEEAVQTGVITAALSWKDWRRHLISWMQQQILTIDEEGFKRREPPSHPSWQEGLWPAPQYTKLSKNHIQSLLEMPTQAIPFKMVNRDLIDTASHFMMQASYEHWLKQEVARQKSWGRQSVPKLIYFDVSAALPPLATLSRLLDRGARIVLFSTNAEVVRQAVESMFNALNSKYSRAEIQQFNQRISWFVGPSPSVPEQYTMKFGAFREFSCRYRDANIQGWAIGSQKMPRQTVEIYGDSPSNKAALKAVNDVFEAVYTVRDIDPDRPLLYRVRSLLLQMLVYYCQDSGNSWQDVLDQLTGMGWSILGSSRFWERFLEFRKVMPEVTEPLPAIGQFSFDQRLLQLKKYSDIAKLSGRRNLEELESGPGHLHRSLVSFAYLLTHALYEKGFFESIELADLYLSDAIGFPKSLGSSLIFAKRLGLLRMAEARYAMEVRSY